MIPKEFWIVVSQFDCSAETAAKYQTERAGPIVYEKSNGLPNEAEVRAFAESITDCGWVRIFRVDSADSVVIVPETDSPVVIGA